jgi:hypothetical protein
MDNEQLLSREETAIIDCCKQVNVVSTLRKPAHRIEKIRHRAAPLGEGGINEC